jgi:hypothetical protein
MNEVRMKIGDVVKIHGSTIATVNGKTGKIISNCPGNKYPFLVEFDPPVPAMPKQIDFMESELELVGSNGPKLTAKKYGSECPCGILTSLCDYHKGE